MKIIVFACITLAIGIGIGIYLTAREFEGEKLPTKTTLAVLNEKETPTPGQGPKLVVEGGESFDFGVMDRGSSDKHNFVFRNVGNEPLVITLLETTCKCTALSAGGKAMQPKDQQTIPSGGSFTLTLDWQVKLSEASFSQSAVFSTNDPRRETVRLLIHGRAVDAIELGDTYLAFNNVTANEPAVVETSLYSHRDEELKILKHEWNDADSKNFLEAAFLPLPDGEAARKGARGGLRVRITLKPGLPLGKTMQHLSLTTNYKGIDLSPIPVEINVVGDVTLIGPKVRTGTTIVVLGTIEQKVGRTHTVYLLVKGPHRHETEAQIVAVEPSTSLKVTLGAPLTDSPTIKRIPVTIEVPPGALLGNYLGTDESKTGRIVLKTSHPQIKEVVIHVRFLVQ